MNNGVCVWEGGIKVDQKALLMKFILLSLLYKKFAPCYC